MVHAAIWAATADTPCIPTELTQAALIYVPARTLTACPLLSFPRPEGGKDKSDKPLLTALNPEDTTASAAGRGPTQQPTSILKGIADAIKPQVMDAWGTVTKGGCSQQTAVVRTMVTPTAKAPQPASLFQAAPGSAGRKEPVCVPQSPQFDVSATPTKVMPHHHGWRGQVLCR